MIIIFHLHRPGAFHLFIFHSSFTLSFFLSCWLFGLRTADPPGKTVSSRRLHPTHQLHSSKPYPSLASCFCVSFCRFLLDSFRFFSCLDCLLVLSHCSFLFSGHAARTSWQSLVWFFTTPVAPLPNGTSEKTPTSAFSTRTAAGPTLRTKIFWGSICMRMEPYTSSFISSC